MTAARKPVFTALGVALIAVCAQIAVPVPPVPFTMQTFAVSLLPALLGWRWSAAAGLVYLALGAVGAPVFSGLRGGFDILLGPTGGYLLSYAPEMLLTGLLLEKTGGSFWGRCAAMAAGLLLCYGLGTAWYAAVYSARTGAVTFWAALTVCVLPYVLPDLAKLALAAWLSPRLKKAIRV